MLNRNPFNQSPGINGKIRVLHCIETISSGGVEQTRLTLAKYLSKDIFELKIICTNARGPIAEKLRKEGVELIVVGTMKHPFKWSIHKKVQTVISSFNPHIIHGAVFEGNSMASISGFLKNVPCIILEETSDPQNRSKKANWLLKILIRLSDLTIAISPNVENYLKRKVKVSSSKIRLICNGVSIPVRRTDYEIKTKKEELGIKKEDFIIGFVGRLYNDHKRITDLIEALALFEQNNVKVLIVGDGADRKLILDHIKVLNLKNRITMTGFASDPCLFYSIMDIACIPSSREGFGLVAVEAMLHKLPVIASCVGGLQDIVVNNETGFLIPPYSPRQIAEKIQILLENFNLRKTMGEKGYLRAMENYTAERYCREVQGLYLELLKSKNILNSPKFGLDYNSKLV
ncbi:glycosyltransferase family 4 protein [Cyclobacterium plantarum]|uniref:glycosyltransferase family 4 protein n=1 Tax=Cyclobacterium plantarum TaxID=2716263 RepID=UPI003F6E7C08